MPRRVYTNSQGVWRADEHNTDQKTVAAVFQQVQRGPMRRIMALEWTDVELRQRKLTVLRWGHLMAPKGGTQVRAADRAAH